MSNNKFLTKLDKVQDVIHLFESMQLSDIGADINAIADLGFPPDNELKKNQMSFFRIKKLAYDKDYPQREAFESVLLSLDNSAFNFVYILEGTKIGIELYIGVVENINNYEGTLSAADYGDNLKNVFEGNFNGSELEPVKGNKLDELVKLSLEKYDNVSAGVITGIPSVNEFESGKDFDFQGIDRLINSMLGLEWRLVVVNEPINKEKIFHLQENIYEIYNDLSMISKTTMQHTESEGISESTGSSVSDTRGKNDSWNKSSGTSSGGQSSSSNSSKGTSGGTNESKTVGTSETSGSNKGISHAFTVEKANKHASEIMKYIDEEMLERLKLGFSKGFFKSSVYYMAKTPASNHRLKVGIMSLFQGNKSSFSPLCAQELNLENPAKLNILTTYQNQSLSEFSSDIQSLALKGRPSDASGVGLNTFLTTKEISLIAGLPQTEVPGITLVEGVGFGLNQRNMSENTGNIIKLGNIVQKGRVLENIPFNLTSSNLMKHTFIAGVTGSGKTTTCHNLLKESGMNFLVLEPAKTEYRTLINNPDFADEKKVVVFTLGNETLAPFRINPFEMIKGEILSAHIDMVKATFTSAFPMEASMPQLLEEAMYNCYVKYGWDIDTNTNEKYGDKAYDKNVNSFPIMSDLLSEMESVVDSKNFGEELKSNYIGSLVSRLSNLTVGAKGNMLNCEHSTDFNYIATHNVIIEMEELKSPEDKALFMGFILTRLSAVIREKHKEDPSFKHLTLIEEAHRLLSKIEYGDSGSKKAAVETFTDLLAEVRKYGEGLIIVDQIPNKLAPEVLKNTNTKIIHKILAKDDKEAVGDTMLMDDKQKEYLSALQVGHAIVFTEGIDKPIHVKVDRVSDTNEDEIINTVVKQRFEENENELGNCYRLRKIYTAYKAYDKVCCNIINKHDDLNEKKHLKNQIQIISNSLQITEDEILKILIERRDSLMGKFFTNAGKYADRFKNLFSFFKKYFMTNRQIDFTNTDVIDIVNKLKK
ncbi:MAG: ATP-binding protein [Treponemataceae bacterium]